MKLPLLAALAAGALVLMLPAASASAQQPAPATVAGCPAEPAQFHVALLDRATEAVLAQGTVRATCAPGCWQPPGGDAFSVQLDVPATAIGTDVLLRVWEGEPGDTTGNTQFDYPLH